MTTRAPHTRREKFTEARGILGWLCVESRPHPHRAGPSTETIHGCFPNRRLAERSATTRAASNPASSFHVRPLVQSITQH
ncbi:hypothetical protein ACTQ49_10070 [Luteococcus sp. Sow4_B9]|uniref:hypothetical protein n=1 Tax=Luteococcus sp. Sow4_B9 TaxID=3438792 RepID=UPI003F956631